MSVNRRCEHTEVVRKMGRVQFAAKRFVDICCATVGLVLLSPIFLIVYVSLKLQADGPVIFSQERIGYKGQPFHIYKFRTMRIDAEAAGPQLAVKGDDRLTPVGRFLRAHHLDELPQLWNVLIGDMSMVGPRPERRYFIERIMQHDPRYTCLYQIRPGVTSEATIYNGYTDTMEKMLERLNIDLHYMETATLCKDFAIMFKTVSVVVFGEKSK